MEKNKKKEFEPSKIVMLSIIVILVVGLITSVVWGMSNKPEELNPYDIVVKADDNFVFLGDSLTDYYPLEEFYDDLPVINSGVSGYTTDDILENLDDMVSIYNPTKVFILIGTNDIMKEKTNDEIMTNIEEIVNRILKKRPKAKIYIESLYPVNNTDNEKINHNMVSIRTNETIKAMNKKIKKYCEQEDYTYIDMYSELLDENGNLDLKYTTEGLHMSNLGYLKITKVLYPYLRQ